jgi:predicted HTH transcriptional regulator
MITTYEQLLAEISAGTCREHKHSNVELKQSWKQDVGKDISGLCNKTSGEVGWVVIGVDDQGRALNRTEKWATGEESQAAGHLNHYLDPYLACQRLESVETDAGWIVVIRVRNPGCVVYWNDKAYKLTGLHSQEMEPEERLGLTLSLPGLNDYTQMQVPVSASEPSSVHNFASRVTKSPGAGIYSDLLQISPEAVLHRLGIRDKQVSRILFGDVGFRFVCYDAAGVPVTNETIKPLYRIFEPSLKDRVDGYARNQCPHSNHEEYPIAAYQEAIANAAAHAAYFESSGEIMVEVFHNRLCVSNLCVKESAHFANRWFSRSHYTLNKLLMEILRLARHVDELGRGKSVIFGDYIASGRESPTVTIE